MAQIICFFMSALFLAIGPFAQHAKGEVASKITRLIFNAIGGACLIGALL